MTTEKTSTITASPNVLFWWVHSLLGSRWGIFRAVLSKEKRRKWRAGVCMMLIKPLWLFQTKSGSKEELQSREWRYWEALNKTLPGFSRELGKQRLYGNSAAQLSSLESTQPGGVRKPMAVFKGLLHFAALVLLQNHRFKSLKAAGKDILNRRT